MLVLKLGVRLRVNVSKNGLQEKDNFLSLLNRDRSQMQSNDLRKGTRHSVGLELILDGRTFSIFGRTYGRNLNYFSFSGFITAENDMFSAVGAAENCLNFN